MTEMPSNLEHELAAMRASLRRIEQAASQRKVIYLGDNTALTHLHTGHKIYVDTRDVGICSHIMWEGRWESWIEKQVIPLLKPGMTVCDIGANFGYYTLLFAFAVGLQGRVLSFEANPHVYKLLSRSVAVNGFAQVNAMNVAVCEAAGEVDFSFDPFFSGGGTMMGAEHALDKIRVSSGALDELIPAETPVQFVKIDVEGAERLVLEGGKRIFASRELQGVLMEFYPNGVGSQAAATQLVDRFSNHGFEASLVEVQGLVPVESGAAAVTIVGSSMSYLLFKRPGM